MYCWRHRGNVVSKALLFINDDPSFLADLVGTVAEDPKFMLMLCSWTDWAKVFLSGTCDGVIWWKRWEALFVIGLAMIRKAVWVDDGTSGCGINGKEKKTEDRAILHTCGEKWELATCPWEMKCTCHGYFRECRQEDLQDHRLQTDPVGFRPI